MNGHDATIQLLHQAVCGAGTALPACLATTEE